MVLTTMSGCSLRASAAVRRNAPPSRSAAAPRPSAPRRVAPLLAPLRASKSPSSADSDNPGPYHSREHTKSRRSNPGGTKDAGVTHRDKDEQFAYQQERLEWRRKNQFEGIEDREEPPHTNMANEPDNSAERRGPEVEGSGHGHGDTLKELVDNVKDSLTGKKKKEEHDGGH